MIELPKNISPSIETLQQLAIWQQEIDELHEFNDKNSKAKSSFSNKNRLGNKAFDEIKEKLEAMCVGSVRCAYCEDSKADEVEHIFPKDLYPEKCFEWENYVYACGTCNGPKNNKFAVFRRDNGQFEKVNIKIDNIVQKPPEGSPVLINPRIENPMDYCILDIKDTFKFVIIAQKGTREYIKADFTYNEVLRLNQQREYLRQARKSAYVNYKSRLVSIKLKIDADADPEEINTLIQSLKEEHHRTVWKEMQRWHLIGELNPIDKELDDLFSALPKSLDW